MSDSLKVSVISPERVLYEGDANGLVAPAFDGEVGILPNHAPFMTLVGEGTLVVRRGESSIRFLIRGGFLQVVDNRVRVVAEHVQGGSHAA